MINGKGTVYFVAPAGSRQQVCLCVRARSLPDSTVPFRFVSSSSPVVPEVNTQGCHSAAHFFADVTRVAGDRLRTRFVCSHAR